MTTHCYNCGREAICICAECARAALKTFKTSNTTERELAYHLTEQTGESIILCLKLAEILLRDYSVVKR